ncbi:MAG: hypothetical protein KGN80_06015 [Acidobacteriota bacterium]|nr:hypothetical protein [Acidobacteriota bacterium]
MGSPRQGHRLLQVAILQFIFAALVGLAIPLFKAPRLALSAHLIALLQGLFLIGLGILWPRLRITSGQSRFAFWLLVYQGIAAPISNLLASVWGAGGSIVPMASGGAHGTAFQEVIVNVGLRTSGATLIIGLLFVAWGLRGLDSELSH